MKEKDHAHFSRTESDQLQLFRPIFKAKERLLMIAFDHKAFAVALML